MLKKIFLSLGVLFFTGFFVFSASLWFFGRQKPPTGISGKKAEELTRRIEEATGQKSWNEIDAVSFRFVRENRVHFRDRQRGFVEVIWKNQRHEYKVQYNRHFLFLSLDNGKAVDPKKAQKLFQKAYHFHTNDFFWLNPFSQMRAPGAQRYFIGERALLIRYTSGGVTPGDSYLISVDKKGLPLRWKMWVGKVPIKGIEFSFGGWETTSNGARLSLFHQSVFLDLKIEDLQVYPSYPYTNTQGIQIDRFRSLTKLQNSSRNP